METAAPARLTYLFEAHFRDGTRITQTQDDVSATTPGRNAYYDVLQRLDEVLIFGVFSEEGRAALVDLRDGHFEIDECPFYAAPTVEPLPPGGRYRLVYFKRRTYHRTVGADGNTQDIEAPTGFMIGWEYILNGNTLHTQVIVVY